ncbi:MAG: tetratricopeptide repeat protein [Myxococcales bacterium]|nr:tetratricopeptide repeat protein [Myxococcales bacterium]
MGKIADILQARGQLDDALRIRQEEELPVYERLGDVRSRAVTMGKIADILTARGQLDDALRIRQEEELPVYERLGDVRSQAVTMGKIADILQARGQLDDALRIRKEEELPVYERLGDERSRAVTMGKIADILHAEAVDDRGEALTALARVLVARGELDAAGRVIDEALAILHPELGPGVRLQVGGAVARGRAHLVRARILAAAGMPREAVDAAYQASSAVRQGHVVEREALAFIAEIKSAS